MRAITPGNSDACDYRPPERLAGNTCDRQSDIRAIVPPECCSPVGPRSCKCWIDRSWHTWALRYESPAAMRRSAEPATCWADSAASGRSQRCERRRLSEWTICISFREARSVGT